MADRLGEYRRKRRPDATPEPAADASPDVESTAQRFVIQEHSATRLHWDLRLERDGVLVSWALPSGIPLDPERNGMAVHTEDHPIEYLDFEGEIPAGNYGAGLMKIWDRGTYEAEKFESGKVILTFNGERAEGRYALFRAGKTERDWMIHRMDPAPEWLEPMPERLSPMIASPGELPRNEDEWAYELGWPGERVLANVTPGKLRLETVAGEDITSKFPEVRRITRALGSVSAILDGVLVSLGPDGRPKPDGVEARLGLASDSTVRRRAKRDPVRLHLFDAPYLEGRVIAAEPYTERRSRLEALDLEGEAWLVPKNHRGDGKALLSGIEPLGLSAIVAKRLASPYEPGPSEDWLTIMKA
ncbi:MAG TPA: DNA polymerase ligase N-terminal domain-containing protein [Solirubrobacterales bacterium]|nr:DNA polymerase ligase N-terminal domain-containing protein [Solirubrobacterales bacterium]